HLWNYLVDQSRCEIVEILFTQTGVVEGRALSLRPLNNFGRAVTERHDNDHRLRFILRNERIEDQIRSAHGGPGARVVAVAVEQIQDRIACAGAWIVAGRSVDEEIAIVSD